MHGERRRRLRQLHAAPHQLRLGGRRQPERSLRRLRHAAPRRRVAGLAVAERARRTLHVRVVHREVLRDHAVHRHGRFREVRQVAGRHVAVDQNIRLIIKGAAMLVTDKKTEYLLSEDRNFR